MDFICTVIVLTRYSFVVTLLTDKFGTVVKSMIFILDLPDFNSSWNTAILANL
jgi:hypothetical protein